MYELTCWLLWKTSSWNSALSSLLFMSLKYNFVEPTRQDGMSTNAKQFAFYHIFDLAWPFLLNQTFRRQRKRRNLRSWDCCYYSVAQLCLTLCDPVNCCTPGFPVHHQLPEFTQTHLHWVTDAIQPSRPLASLSPPAFNLSQHQGLFQWVGSSQQGAKVLELQLQHQSIQINHSGLISFRIDWF